MIQGKLLDNAKKISHFKHNNLQTRRFLTLCTNKIFNEETQMRKFATKPNFKETITAVEDAVEFMVNCFVAVGTSKLHAEIVARNLVSADANGHYSHGMNRLERYIVDIKREVCRPNAVPAIVKETASTAYVNGCNALGAVIGKFCMELAMQKAKCTGVGVVSAFNSNHYGSSGLYSRQAAKENLIGISFTNTSPLMVTTRNKKPCLGTNPIGFGAPTGECHDKNDVIVDISTTAVALGKIEFFKKKGALIPYGWALNTDGKIETDPSKAKLMLPLGGDEDHSGYKGFALNMIVEIFSGILSGSNYGMKIRTWGQGGGPANLGQFFLAIDQSKFVKNFGARMQEYVKFIRNMEPLNPKKPVLIPGDVERIHQMKVKELGGLSYVPSQILLNIKLAAELNVEPMKFTIVKPEPDTTGKEEEVKIK